MISLIFLDSIVPSFYLSVTDYWLLAPNFPALELLIERRRGTFTIISKQHNYLDNHPLVYWHPHIYRWYFLLQLYFIVEITVKKIRWINYSAVHDTNATELGLICCDISKTGYNLGFENLVKISSTFII